MDLLRRNIPKYFFKCVNRQLSFNQNSCLMIKFRSRVEDGEIIEEQSLADYLAGLYTYPNLALERPVRSPILDEDLISEAELSIAREKLS